MGKEKKPKYLGSWKGRVIRSISVDGAKSWSEIRDHTGLSPKSLNAVLAELMNIKRITKVESKSGTQYRVDYDLYKEYQSYYNEITITPQISKKVIIPEIVQTDLHSWIDGWKDVKRMSELIDLKNKHFYLEGRFLDDFSKDIIEGAQKEIMVVNPFVENCDLSDMLWKAAKKGIHTSLVTRPADNIKKEKFHKILKENGVILYYHASVHAKIIIVDRAVAISSSMNFISASSSGASWEAGLVTINNKIVENVLNSVLSLQELPYSQKSAKN